jgi:hypothetical protein
MKVYTVNVYCAAKFPVHKFIVLAASIGDALIRLEGHPDYKAAQNVSKVEITKSVRTLIQ